MLIYQYGDTACRITRPAPIFTLMRVFFNFVKLLWRLLAPLATCKVSERHAVTARGIESTPDWSLRLLRGAVSVKDGLRVSL